MDCFAYLYIYINVYRYVHHNLIFVNNETFNTRNEQKQTHSDRIDDVTTK